MNLEAFLIRLIAEAIYLRGDVLSLAEASDKGESAVTAELGRQGLPLKRYSYQGATLEAVRDLCTAHELKTQDVAQIAFRKDHRLLCGSIIGNDLPLTLGNFVELPFRRVRDNSQENLEFKSPPPAPAKAPSPAAQSKPKAGKTATTKSDVILIVEDDNDQRDILELILHSENYEVVSAANGREALDILAKTRPILVITDLMMPVLDGAGLVREMKAQEALKTIPIMVLTVLADAEREFSLLSLGADDYCEKSTQKKVLLKRIEKLIQRPQ